MAVIRSFLHRFVRDWTADYYHFKFLPISGGQKHQTMNQGQIQQDTVGSFGDCIRLLAPRWLFCKMSTFLSVNFSLLNQLFFRLLQIIVIFVGPVSYRGALFKFFLLIWSMSAEA